MRGGGWGWGAAERQWEAQEGAGRGKNEGLTKGDARPPSSRLRPTFLQGLMVKQDSPQDLPPEGMLCLCLAL